MAKKRHLRITSQAQARFLGWKSSTGGLGSFSANEIKEKLKGLKVKSLPRRSK
jgi:hypothetical protein